VSPLGGDGRKENMSEVESFEEIREREPSPLWVWVLDRDMASVYAAHIFYSVCPECGKRKLQIIDFSFTSVPLEFLVERAVVFVPPVQYESRSGLSWEHCPGFFSRAEDLRSVIAPKVMGMTQLHIPEPAWKRALADFRAVYTVQPVEISIPERKRICFQCLMKKMPEPDYRQGGLRIWKVKEEKTDPTYIYARKVEAHGIKTSNIFNHTIQGLQFIFHVRDWTKGWLKAYKPVTITSPNHPDLQLPEGEYVLYHPRPRRGGD